MALKVHSHGGAGEDRPRSHGPSSRLLSLRCRAGGRGSEISPCGKFTRVWEAAGMPACVTLRRKARSSKNKVIVRKTKKSPSPIAHPVLAQGPCTTAGDHHHGEVNGHRGFGLKHRVAWRVSRRGWDRGSGPFGSSVAPVHILFCVTSKLSTSNLHLRGQEPQMSLMSVAVQAALS